MVVTGTVVTTVQGQLSVIGTVNIQRFKAQSGIRTAPEGIHMDPRTGQFGREKLALGCASILRNPREASKSSWVERESKEYF